MLDLLYTLRSTDGPTTSNAVKCSWQDLPSRIKLDASDNEVNLTAHYLHLLFILKNGAPAVTSALEILATSAEQLANHPIEAGLNARIASGWLSRLSRRDFTSTTWDADYSRLDGFWAYLRDAQVGLERCLLHHLDDTTTGESPDAHSQTRLRITTVGDYVTELAGLQAGIDSIESARTTLAQKVLRRLSGTMAVLWSAGAAPAADDDDDFWNEESVGSFSRTT